MLRNSKLTQKALRVAYGIAFCAFGGTLAFGLAGCQILPPNNPTVSFITDIVIENPDATARLTQVQIRKYWSSHRRRLEHPDLPEREDLKIRKPTESAIFAEDFTLAYYHDRIKEMQAAGELPWFEVDNLDVSYSYAMDEKRNRAEFTLEVVATRRSDWDAIRDNWDDVDVAIQKLIDEYLSSTLIDEGWHVLR